jgi:hypothetical protein
MTPEEYERFKQAEKEHLKKLKELKQAVRALERQERIQSTLQDVSRSSEEALETQNDMVERLALETAHREARLEMALESPSEERDALDLDELEDELRRERARSLVDEMKASMQRNSAPGPGTREEQPAPLQPDRRDVPDRGADKPSAQPRTATENPTRSREERPDKTIGRM